MKRQATFKKKKKKETQNNDSEHDLGSQNGEDTKKYLSKTQKNERANRDEQNTRRNMQQSN